MAGFLTKAREASNADNPRFGEGGGSYLDNGAMIAREVVFGITDVRWDPDNVFNGENRPRWLIDVIPWYDGETLPASRQDSRGRPQQLDAGTLSLMSQATRDQMLNSLVKDLDQAFDEDPDYVEGPAVLVNIKIPGGRGGKYIDICAWDEEKQAPLDAAGEIVTEDEPAPPRRPNSRQAPARNAAAGQPRPARSRQPEPEEEPEPEPEEKPARRPAAGRSRGFEEAGGAESGGSAPAPAPASNYDLVNDTLLGEGWRQRKTARPYQPGDLGGEYDYEASDDTFPGIKEWCRDHDLAVPEGRGRIARAFYDVREIALGEWEELRQAAGVAEPPQDNASRTSPNPAVRSGKVAPTGAQHTRQRRAQAAETASEAAQEEGRDPDAPRPPNGGPPPRGDSRSRRVQPAQVPANARHQNEELRPANAPAADSKAAWMPPDEAQRRARGAGGATEHVYSLGDVGDSVDACPGCQEVVTGRALPSGGGSYAIMHQCAGDGVTRPLQAVNIRPEEHS